LPGVSFAAFKFRVAFAKLISRPVIAFTAFVAAFTLAKWVGLPVVEVGVVCAAVFCGITWAVSVSQMGVTEV